MTKIQPKKMVTEKNKTIEEKSTDNKRNLLWKALKKHLGAQKIIASRVGMTSQYVYLVLSGRRKNTMVLSVAGEVLVELEQQESDRRIQLDANLAQAELLTQS